MRILMTTLLATLIIGGSLILSPNSTTAIAKERATAKQCASWERQLAKVQKKLRRGYSAKQSNKLRDKRRELQDKLRKYCK